MMLKRLQLNNYSILQMNWFVITRYVSHCYVEFGTFLPYKYARVFKYVSKTGCTQLLHKLTFTYMPSVRS